jgi:hypothetical protein
MNYYIEHGLVSWVTTIISAHRLRIQTKRIENGRMLHHHQQVHKVVLCDLGFFNFFFLQFSAFLRETRISFVFIYYDFGC